MGDLTWLQSFSDKEIYDPYDGVAYFSKQLDDERFASVAINLTLFAEFRKDRVYGTICDSIKVDESMNYQLFKQLFHSMTYPKYGLRIESKPFITNIGEYRYQYNNRETEFYHFDQYLFDRWKDKDSLPWGNAL